MNIIFSGQPGINKSIVLENLLNAINHCINFNENNVGDSKNSKVYSAESAIAGDPISFKTFIEIEDPEELEKTWENGFSKLLKTIKSDACNNNFLAMHVMYRKFGEFFSPINWNRIREFKPDLFITLIDDIYDIRWRLPKSSPIQQSNSFVLKEIIDWRALEILSVDKLAHYLLPDKKIPHYVFGIKNPSISMARLILKPEAMRLYAAYPITDAREDDEAMKEIESHKKEMHSNYVVFDPGAIDEMLLHYKFKEWESQPSHSRGSVIGIDIRNERIKMRGEKLDLPQLSDGIKVPRKLEFSPKELEEVDSIIKHQVPSRDYIFISQSNIMTAYRPNFRKKPSVGMIRELDYAGLKRKVRYQYWHEEDGVPDHPFLGKGTFSYTYEDFLVNLNNHQDQLSKLKNDKSHNSEFII